MYWLGHWSGIRVLAATFKFLNSFAMLIHSFTDTFVSAKNILGAPKFE